MEISNLLKLCMFLFQALSNAERPQRKSPTKPRKEDSRNREPTNNDPVNNDPRMMAEYQTALELEMWKQQQEELFTAQVCLTNLYIRRAAGSNSCRRLVVAFFCNCSVKFKIVYKYSLISHRLKEGLQLIFFNYFQYLERGNILCSPRLCYLLFS